MTTAALVTSLAATLVAAPAGADDDTGPADTPDGDVAAAIADGEPAAQNPQVAQLTVSFPSSASTCTGTFVADHHILTAAHCFVLDDGTRAVGASAVSGSTSFRPAAPGHWSSAVDAVSVNPGYAPADTVAARNDLALVRTVEPSPYGRPAMPFMGSDLEPRWGDLDSIGIIFGSGSTAPNTPTDLLWQAFFGTRGDAACASIAAGSGLSFDPREAICAEGFDPDGPRDPEVCPGDSGGPFFALTTDGQPAVAGTVSLGVFPSPPGACISDSVVFLTRVSRHADWITEITGASPIARLPRPVVDAGPSRTIGLGESAALDGTAVGHDNVRWTKVAGPGTATFGDDSAVDTTVTFDRPGRYSLRLTATNGAGSTSDATSVTVRASDDTSSGYFVLEEDGEIYAFGGARAVLRGIDPAANDVDGRGATISRVVRDRLAGTGVRAVAMEITADEKGLWILLSDGQVWSLGGAAPMPGVPAGVMTGVVAGQPEQVAAMARLGSGALWVFTSAGRVIPQSGGALPPAVVKEMDVVSGLDLLGPVIDAKPTQDGEGVLALASDGGVFTYDAQEEFLGSVWNAIAEALGVPVGSVGPDRPVVGITMDPDGEGYWISAEDGGVFAMRGKSPFRGSLPAIVPFDRLVAPIGGMVPFGNGYLLVGDDGGVFNFSDEPFAGSASGLIDTRATALVPL